MKKQPEVLETLLEINKAIAFPGGFDSEHLIGRGFIDDIEICFKHGEKIIIK